MNCRHRSHGDAYRAILVSHSGVRDWRVRSK